MRWEGGRTGGWEEGGRGQHPIQSMQCFGGGACGKRRELREGRGERTPLPALTAFPDTSQIRVVVSQSGRSHERLGDIVPRPRVAIRHSTLLQKFRQARVLPLAPLRSGLWHFIGLRTSISISQVAATAANRLSASQLDRRRSLSTAFTAVSSAATEPAAGSPAVQSARAVLWSPRAATDGA